MAATNLTKVSFFLVAFFSSLFLAAVAVPSENLEALATVKRVNRKGPYLGIISVDPITEAPPGFENDPDTPSVDLSGRSFMIGKQDEVNVIYVGSGVGLVNAAATTQLMLDYFDMSGIIHYGVAGNANTSMNIGDVVIPRQFAQTGLWDWQNPNEPIPGNDVVGLDFGSFSVPNGLNRLGSIGYRREEFFYESGQVNKPVRTLSFPVERSWLEKASTLENIELQQCESKSVCLPERPHLRIGLRGSTANFFIENEAYREFLFKNFRVSSVDMESAAVVMTCLSNGKPVIVVRGLSNLAGAKNGREQREKFRTLPHRNAVIVVREMVQLLGREHSEIFRSNLKLHGNF